MIKSNYHTHSTFCDGRDSVESIVECAIQKGFKYLGFHLTVILKEMIVGRLKKIVFLNTLMKF